MVLKIIPHNWQNYALINWENNNYQGINVLPTSSGKTIFAILCMLKVRKSCLIICHTEVLAKQWYDELKKFIDIDFEKNVGFYYGKHKDIKPITIGLIQTLSKEYDKDWTSKFKMLILDEVHNFSAETYWNFLENNNFEMKLGLTATLERADGEHIRLLDYMGGLNYKLKESDVKEMDLISKFTLINYGIIMDDKDRVEYDDYESKLTKYMDKMEEFAKSKVNPFARIPNEDKRISVYKMHYRRIFQKEKKFLATYYLKNKHCFKLIKDNPNKKILIFNEINDNSQNLYDILKHNGYNPLILNTTTKKKQKEIIDKFSTSEYNILIATKMVDEGFSIDDIDIGIAIYSSKTKKQIKQRVGRVIRKSKNEHKEFYQIYLVDTRDEKYNDERTKHIDYADDYKTIIV